MAVLYKLESYTQLVSKEIFFDSNVVIYLFWPTGQHLFESNYAKVFRNLLRQGNTLYVDFLVISEVINRVLRIEHSKLGSNLVFKDFRNSKIGRDVITDIYLIVKNDILKRFQIVSKSFNQSDIEDFLSVDQLDFVDKAIASICAENNLVLLTNDKDFKNSSLEILTDNPFFFK